jgi:hypothetical protein
MSKQILLFAGSAHLMVFDLIVKRNPNYPLEPTDLLYGVPQAVLGPLVSVTLTPIPTVTNNYEGPEAIEYNRVNLNDYFQGLPNPQLSAAGGITPAALCQALNDQYRIYFSSENTDTLGQQNYVVVTTNIVNGVGTATFTPDPGHLVWVGSQTFTLTNLPSS